MLDHHEIRLWAEHGAALATWLRRLAGQLQTVCGVLVRHLYAAPWHDAGEADCGATPALRSDGSVASRRP